MPRGALLGDEVCFHGERHFLHHGCETDKQSEFTVSHILCPNGGLMARGRQKQLSKNLIPGHA